MFPPTHYRGNSSPIPNIEEYRDKIRAAQQRRKYFEENPTAPGAKEYFAARRDFEKRVMAAFQPLLDDLADCRRITAEDLATRVG